MIVGAIADRSEQPARLLGIFAWLGAAAACMLFFLVGTNWRFGALMMIIATIGLGASLVVYDAIPRPDRPSGRPGQGQQPGLGPGLPRWWSAPRPQPGHRVQAGPDRCRQGDGGPDQQMLSAGLWWALFTLIPVLGLRRLRGSAVARDGQVHLADAPSEGAVGGSIAQLQHTFRPQEVSADPDVPSRVLLFFNDGIQTVIASSSIYGAEQLKFAQEQLIALILLVQFVAFGGALFFGWLASKFGAWRTILWSLVAWSAIVVMAFFVPEKAFLPFIALGVLIGIVLGACRRSRAASSANWSPGPERRSSSPSTRPWSAAPRGSGPSSSALVHQVTHSYRPAIVALIPFFALGCSSCARWTCARASRTPGTRCRPSSDLERRLNAPHCGLVPVTALSATMKYSARLGSRPSASAWQRNPAPTTREHRVPAMRSHSTDRRVGTPAHINHFDGRHPWQSAAFAGAVSALLSMETDENVVPSERQITTYLSARTGTSSSCRSRSRPRSRRRGSAAAAPTPSSRTASRSRRRP